MVPDLRTPGKRILIISPQPWDGFRVSKHHYATQLAGRGHAVYFLDPPLSKGRAGAVYVTPGLRDRQPFMVRYKPCVPYRLKFHFRRAFELAMRLQARLIARACGGGLDLVWDFDNTYTFESLLPFGAKTAIFSLVDQPATGRTSTKKSDIVFGIADSILAEIELNEVPRYVVGHGLAPEYVEFGRMQLRSESLGVTAPISRVGYVGNLLASSIDGETILAMVAENPQLQFEFFGPFEAHDPSAIPAWLEALRRKKNCLFHGLVNAEFILSKAKHIGAWLLFYDHRKDRNGGADSHKVLEYLATGAPVVSSRLEAYVGTGLLVMPATKSNDDLPALLKGLVSEPQNCSGSARLRIEYALERSYGNRLDFIIDRVSALGTRVRK